MKPKTRKPSSLLDEGKPALQLNSHQFIVSIVILLVYSCVLIAVGIAIGRWQNSYAPKRLAQKQQTEIDPSPQTNPRSKPDEQPLKAPEDNPEAVKTDEGREGSQTFPRPDALAEQRAAARENEDGFVPVPAPAPRGARTRNRTSSKPAESDAKETEKPETPDKPAKPVTPPPGDAAKPSPVKEGPETPVSPKPDAPAAPKPETPESVKPEAASAPPAPKPESPEPATAEQAPTPDKPSTPEPAESKAPAVATATQAKPAPELESRSELASAEDIVAKPSTTGSAAAASGNYVVQIAAYALKNRSQAEKFRKTFESKTGVTAEVAISEKDGLVRIWAGRSTTEKAAREVRDKLRAHKEYAECYVKKAK